MNTRYSTNLKTLILRFIKAYKGQVATYELFEAISLCELPKGPVSFAHPEFLQYFRAIRELIDEGKIIELDDEAETLILPNMTRGNLL